MSFLKGNYFLGFLILLALLVAVVQNAFVLHLPVSYTHLTLPTKRIV